MKFAKFLRAPILKNIYERLPLYLQQKLQYLQRTVEISHKLFGLYIFNLGTRFYEI